MTENEFKSLPVYDDLTQVKDPFKGMKFLHGRSVIGQQDTKNVGDIITYYEIVDVRPNKTISMASRMEKMTGARIEG